MSEFIKLRKRWKKVLIGETREKNLSIYEKNLITIMDTTVTKYLEKMCQSENRSYLWEDERDFTQSQKQTNNYRRLFEMCKVYSIDGSLYYKDKNLLRIIQEALEFCLKLSENFGFDVKYLDNKVDSLTEVQSEEAIEDPEVPEDYGTYKGNELGEEFYGNIRIDKLENKYDVEEIKEAVLDTKFIGTSNKIGKSLDKYLENITYDMQSATIATSMTIKG